jgi:integrase/recombinase XerC
MPNVTPLMPQGAPPAEQVAVTLPREVLDHVNGPAALLAAWRSGKKALTVAAYDRDVDDFARWQGGTPAAAIARLLTCTAGQAHQVALRYLEHLQGRGLASATCSRRLSALRSLARLARMCGLISWYLEVPSPKVTPYRDTRGPGRAGMHQLIAVAEQQQEPKRSRDLAILWLLYGRALRRAEVASLRLPADIDLVGERIQVLGKHRTEREWLTVPPATCRAIVQWLAVRGDAPGPLFFRLDRAATDHIDDRRSVTGLAIAHLVAALGKRAGLTVRPHGLRHSAITEVLDATRGDFRAAQRFGRLAKADTLRYYDDNREDLGGQAARLIAP